MAKISRNPQIAYAQGIKEGEKRSNEGGFAASNGLFLLAYYNVIDEYVKTAKTQAGLINAIETEIARLFDEEFMSDVDKVEVACAKLNEIRKHFKMEGEISG